MRLLTYPSFGRIGVRNVMDEDAHPYTSIFEIYWFDIPSEKVGSTGIFLIQSCIRNGTSEVKTDAAIWRSR